MNVYKTAISALILAPIVGGVSINILHNYMNVKEQAEQLSLTSQEQLRQVEALLDESGDGESMEIGEVLGGRMGIEIEDEEEAESEIEAAVLRFHVRANSDSEEDQALKLLVRDGVLKEMEPLLTEVESREEAEEVIEAHLTEIEQLAEAIVHEAGYDYAVQAYMTEEEFPIKEYGDMRFPSGTYLALRIDIGKHEGANWWCVMYPGLCFVETTGGVVASEGKEELQKVLSAEEYAQLLINPPEDAEVEYKSLLWEKLKQALENERI